MPIVGLIVNISETFKKLIFLDNFEIECILGSHHKISRRKDICSSETLETNIGEDKHFLLH